MKTKDFPIYDDHDSVMCFNCGKAIGGENHTYSGYPTFRGSFQVVCHMCNMITLYDISLKYKQINRTPRIGELIIYHGQSGDITYKVHSHFRMDGILNIEDIKTGGITQIIAEFKKGEFNHLLEFVK